MWYTVAKKEFEVNGRVVKAGSIYKAKSFDFKIGLSYSEPWVNFVAIDDMVASVPFVNIPKKACLDFFTKPVKDLDSAMEESFMVCERVYC